MQRVYSVCSPKPTNNQLALQETVFHNANGYLGVRGTLEEGAPQGMDTMRGAYVNGFYEIVPMKQAEKLLTEAGIPFTRLLAEENGEEAARLGIRQAPTLVVGSEEDKYVGLGAVRKFIAEYND